MQYITLYIIYYLVTEKVFFFFCNLSPSQFVSTKKHVPQQRRGLICLLSFAVPKYVRTSLNFKARSVFLRKNLSPEVTVTVAWSLT